jgi:hypothetical protein
MHHIKAGALPLRRLPSSLHVDTSSVDGRPLSHRGVGPYGFQLGEAGDRGVVPYPPACKPYGLEAGTESSRRPGSSARHRSRSGEAGGSGKCQRNAYSWLALLNYFYYQRLWDWNTIFNRVNWKKRPPCSFVFAKDK